MIIIINNMYMLGREIRWTDPPQLPVERQKRNPSRGSSRGRNGSGRTALPFVSNRF